MGKNLPKSLKKPNNYSIKNLCKPEIFINLEGLHNFFMLPIFFRLVLAAGIIHIGLRKDNLVNKQSNLYEEISLKQIQLIFHKTMHIKEPIKAELLSGGLFNTTYHVYSKDFKLDTVLRLGPVNRQLLLRFEENLMEAEKYVYELCKKEKIECSEVLACDTSKTLINRDFMIVRYIPSVAMSNTKLTEEQKTPLYMEIGRKTKKMHCITNQTFGRVSEILSGLEFTSWQEYLLSELEDICSRLINHNGIGLKEAARAKTVLNKYENWLNEIEIPRLIHTDLWEGNILLNKQDKKIAAIIDSDRAIFGDPDYDLSCPWLVNDNFLTGYQIEANVFHNEEFLSKKRITRRKIYNMMYRLLEAYVGFSEYNNPEAYENNLRDAIRLIDELEQQSR